MSIFNRGKSLVLMLGACAALACPQLVFASCANSFISLGSDDAGSYYVGQGEGCIQKPLTQVWAELKTQDAMSFSGSTLESSDAIAPAPGALLTYENQYKAGGFISVSWTMDWSHILKGGTADNPTALQIHYEKVSGTSFIGYWEGDIELQADGSSTTVSIRNQIHASDTSQSDAQGTVQEIFDKLK